MTGSQLPEHDLAPSERFASPPKRRIPQTMAFLTSGIGSGQIQKQLLSDKQHSHKHHATHSHHADS